MAKCCKRAGVPPHLTCVAPCQQRERRLPLRRILRIMDLKGVACPPNGVPDLRYFGLRKKR